MSQPARTPPSVEARLLSEPRRVAGLDSRGQPVRLGERDSDGHLVGYIDNHGLGWESLRECLVATHAGPLARALALPHDDPRRDELIERALDDLPDELIAEVAQQAAALLWLRGERP
jgi:hypothetical protein